MSKVITEYNLWLLKSFHKSQENNVYIKVLDLHPIVEEMFSNPYWSGELHFFQILGFQDDDIKCVVNICEKIVKVGD